jgi:hypothetical protein
VVDAAFKLTPHRSKTGRENAGSFPRHRAVEYFSPAPFPAEQGCDRQAAVFKDQLGHKRCAETHLVFPLPDPKPRGSLFHDESTDTGGAKLWIEGAVDNEQIGDRSVRHKDFPAVQDVAAAIVLDVSLHREISDPAFGSLAPLAPMRLPSHSPGRYFFFCSVVPYLSGGIELVHM